MVGWSQITPELTGAVGGEVGGDVGGEVGGLVGEEVAGAGVIAAWQVLLPPVPLQSPEQQSLLFLQLPGD